MSNLNSEQFDVVVIGAGISGLVCGCYLSQAGMKVLIVEQHNKPGGYCTSFKRQNFTFDAAAHSFGSYREGGNFRQIVRELGIDKNLTISRFNPSDTILAPDFQINFWNDPKDTIVDLTKVFPKEKKNIEAYFDYYNSLSSGDQLESIKLKDKTFASFLNSFFNDTTLISAISFPVFGNGGLPPSLMHSFTGTKIFHEFLIDGGYYPAGGMQKLPNAFSDFIKQNHGTILFKRFAKRILVHDNAVAGIELDNNETVTARYVVSACDLTQTYSNFLIDVVDRNLISKLENMIPSMSTLTLYIGIDEPFKGLPKEGTNIWYLPCYDLDKLYNGITAGNLENGGFMFRVSPDKKTILAFCGAPFKSAFFWKQNKKSIAEGFLNRLEKIIPNLKKHIVFFDAASPYTQYRYTLNYRGANYGWAPSQSQLFDHDFRQKSFIKGLYLTGHWTCQTHGIPGVAYLGHNAAKLILKNVRKIAQPKGIV